MVEKKGDFVCVHYLLITSYVAKYVNCESNIFCNLLPCAKVFTSQKEIYYHLKQNNIFPLIFFHELPLIAQTM